MDKVKSLDDFRRLQGSKAYHFGQLFEQMFHSMCKRNGVACTRFPDGCRQAGSTRLIRVKTPFDWIITRSGKTALIDTKTSDQLTFPHSKITSHQISEMIHHELSGGLAGYVIWLRKSDSVIFVPALELSELARAPGSIQPHQMKVKLLGTGAYFDTRLIFSSVGGPPENSTNKEGPTDAA